MKKMLIGPALLARFVSLKAGVPTEIATKVIDAYDDQVLHYTGQGAKVRALGVGHFQVREYKATRRRSPTTGRLVSIKPRLKLTFSMARKVK